CSVQGSLVWYLCGSVVAPTTCASAQGTRTAPTQYATAPASPCFIRSHVLPCPAHQRRSGRLVPASSVEIPSHIRAPANQSATGSPTGLRSIQTPQTVVRDGPSARRGLRVRCTVDGRCTCRPVLAAHTIHTLIFHSITTHFTCPL
ncbi:hypothetical protein JB92DRAFT_2849722, partial [Gautieria morchelliformis]